MWLIQKLYFCLLAVLCYTPAFAGNRLLKSTCPLLLNLALSSDHAYEHLELEFEINARPYFKTGALGPRHLGVSVKDSGDFIFRRRSIGRFIAQLSHSRKEPAIDIQDTHELLKNMQNKQYYNFVINNHKLIMSSTSENKIEDLMSKHFYLNSAENAEVFMAGRMWKDDDGTLHIENNSGTYLPSNEKLDEAELFFREGLLIPKVVKHYWPE